MARGPAWKILVAAYGLLCAVVLAYAIAARDIRDTDIFVAYAMLVLTFPAGYVVAILFGVVAHGLNETFGVIFAGGLINNIFTIAVLGVVGFAQWFMFVPWLWRKVERAI